MKSSSFLFGKPFLSLIFLSTEFWQAWIDLRFAPKCCSLLNTCTVSVNEQQRVLPFPWRKYVRFCSTTTGKFFQASFCIAPIPSTNDFFSIRLITTDACLSILHAHGLLNSWRAACQRRRHCKLPRALETPSCPSILFAASGRFCLKISLVIHRSISTNSCSKALLVSESV